MPMFAMSSGSLYLSKRALSLLVDGAEDAARDAVGAGAGLAEREEL